MEILGLLDALESMILDSFKLPFTKKLVINEDKILAVIDKIRLVAQGGGSFAKDAIGKGMGKESGEKVEKVQAVEAKEVTTAAPKEGGEAVDILQQAYQMAKEIREGADKYADEVLANLEATSGRILRTIQAGRERLAKSTKAGESK